MTKLFWLQFLFSFPVLLAGQNLIPNPGFEQCDKCDNRGFKELSIGFGANDPADWTAATYGTPDFQSVSPHTGKKHGGFFVGFPKFEYLTNHFTACLKKDAVYQFSFWISPDTRSPNYIVDEIGVYIQQGPCEFKQPDPLKQLTPVYQSDDGDFIGKSGYRLLRFEYTAKGGEDHFVVGRFRNLGLGDTTFVGTKRPANPSSEPVYYFVDDFEMIQISQNPVIDLIPDVITLCPGEKKQLTIPSPYNQGAINWSTGQKTATIDVPEINTVYVEVTLNDACKTIIKDSTHIIIRPLAQIQIIGSDSICEGGSTLLTATCDSCLELSWNSLLVTMPGEYTVTAKTNCGEQTVSKKIVLYDDHGQIAIDGVDEICTGDKKELTAHCDRCTDLSWTKLEISQPGEYTVTAKTICKEITATKKIGTANQQIDSLVRFPNVVFPNGQDINHSFKPVIKKGEEGRIMNFTFTIFNRWGQTLIKTKVKEDEWQPDPGLPMDTYLYIGEIEYQDCNGIKKNGFKGTVTLVR